MSASAFVVAFEGEAFDDGEIDVRDLAPALLALGDVVTAANEALNGSRATASLKLRATAEGSFQALLSVDVSILGVLGDMLDAVTQNPDRVVAADQLMELLLKGGTVVGGTAYGLFRAIKWLRGRKPDAAEPRSDGTVQIAANGSTVVVDRRVFNLLQDGATRAAVAAFSRKALSIDGIAAVRMGDPAAPDDTIRLEPADKASLEAIPGVDDAPEVAVENEREVLLRVVSVHFRDGYKWRFSDGGDKPFTAAVEDHAFLASVSSGQVSLSANDVLRCVVREDQVLRGGALSTARAVVRVVEHIAAPKQEALF